MVEHAVLGGVASVAGGGKFANGVVTAAFGYMFNDAMHNCFSHCASDGAEVPNAQSVSVGPAEIVTAGIAGGVRTLFGTILGSITSPDNSPDISFRTEHAAPHLDGTGLSAEVIEGTIRSEISAQSGVGTEFSGLFSGRVSVQGQTWEYRAYVLPNGKISVGTYFPVN